MHIKIHLIHGMGLIYRNVLTGALKLNKSLQDFCFAKAITNKKRVKITHREHEVDELIANHQILLIQFRYIVSRPVSFLAGSSYRHITTYCHSLPFVPPHPLHAPSFPYGKPKLFLIPGVLAIRPLKFRQRPIGVIVIVLLKENFSLMLTQLMSWV